MKLEKTFQDKPDFEHFRKVVLRETREGPVPIIELMADAEIMSEVTGMEFPNDGMAKLSNPDISGGQEAVIELIHLGVKFTELSLEFAKAVGYDYATMVPIVPVPRTPMQTRQNPKQQDKLRNWQNEHQGIVASRQDLDALAWPAPEQIIMFPLDFAAGKMPQGMKAMAFYIGMFEDLRSLMGFESMAVKSIEEPDLLDDILERLTVLGESAMEKIASHPATGMVFYADDMGYNAGTILSPAWFKEHLIPRQKRLADICHKHHKPFILHSCGNINAIMDDLIDTVGIDGRHAFQDNIEPIETAYKKYGDRISLLGGVEVNLLATATPAQVRQRTRKILETCAPSGGICIGTGNTVTNYCKIENYYAMIDEVREWNERYR